MRAIHIVCAGALGPGILTIIAAATPDPAPAQVVRNSNAAATKVRYGARTAEFSFKPGETIRLNAGFTSVE